MCYYKYLINDEYALCMDQRYIVLSVSLSFSVITYPLHVTISIDDRGFSLSLTRFSKNQLVL